MGAATVLHVLGCDTLIGDCVVDARGESLGVLADVMLDVAAGRIAYAVVGCGGVLGLGERLHAVPWSALRLDADQGRLVLDIDRETLQKAPAFDRAHWPSTADAAWTEVDRYYEKRA